MGATAFPGLPGDLVGAGLLDESVVRSVLNTTEARKQPVKALIAAKAISALDLAKFASRHYRVPLVDLDRLSFEGMPIKSVSRAMSENCSMVAIHLHEACVTLAVADPSYDAALDQVRFTYSLQPQLVVATLDQIQKLIDRAYTKASDKLAALAGGDFDMASLDEDQGSEEDDEDPDPDGQDDAPVVRFVQKVLLDAIERGASDIHFEPYEKEYRVRLRTDGQLSEYARPPHALREKLAARIKVISNLDISDRRLPQDGRMKLQIAKNKAIDFRVSTLPTLYGEKIVLRILDPTSAMLGIDALGYEPEQKQALMDAIGRPYGMVLVTGPTGSGKTVSLYTCLNILNKDGTNISTAEDPAEIQLTGINQVNVNDKIGLTFSAALKSFLRQDPDIIMVGEIRDLDTASIAIKASQTGHLVLSTLHTNDAPSTLERLRNIGVEPFNIASSVHLITAQRLARRLCSCKTELELPRSALLRAGFTDQDLAQKWTLYGPKGCDRCGGSGYKGRVGIYQVMPISEAMREVILNEGSSMQIADIAEREGVSDLRRSGLRKVMAGLTSIEEVLATTNE